MALPPSIYVPTLAIRASEMNGLEQLPSLTKDKMRPMFLLAPWATANTLTKAIERLEKAYPKRPYFLDIDKNYSFTNLESAAQQELQALSRPNNAYENWREFVSSFPNANPCIQTHNQSSTEISQQISAAQDAGKEFCIRIENNRFPTNFDEITEALNRVGTADYAVLLEGGWTKDPLTLFAWFSGLVNGVLSEIDANIPIIISCTSIPKEFTSITGHTSVPFNNRTLVNQIATTTNRRFVLYGDWGSTRPRDNRGGGQRPIDRIDYPTDNSWVIARNKESNWTFRDAAKDIIEKSGFWDGHLNIWGENMIEQTAVNESFAINTPPKNVAARVNIHLHRQAFFGNQIDNIDFDEDWND